MCLLLCSWQTKWLKYWTSWLSLATSTFPHAMQQAEPKCTQEKANILSWKTQVPTLFAFNIFVLETNASHTPLEVFYWSNVRTIRSQRWWNYSSVKFKPSSLLSHHLLALSICLHLWGTPWLPTNQYPDSSYVPHASYMVGQSHILVHNRLLCQLLEKYTSAASRTQSPHYNVQYCIWHLLNRWKLSPI